MVVPAGKVEVVLAIPELWLKVEGVRCIRNDLCHRIFILVLVRFHCPLFLILYIVGKEVE